MSNRRFRELLELKEEEEKKGREIDLEERKRIIEENRRIVQARIQRMQESTLKMKEKRNNKNKRKGVAKERTNKIESKKSDRDKIKPIIRNEKFEKYSKYFTEGFSYPYSSKIESCFRCNEAKNSGRVVYLKEESIIICKDCYNKLIQAKRASDRKEKKEKKIKKRLLRPPVLRNKSFKKYAKFFTAGLSDPYPHLIQCCRGCAYRKIGGRIVHLKEETIIICNDCFKALGNAANSSRKSRGGGSSVRPIYTPMRG